MTRRRTLYLALGLALVVARLDRTGMAEAEEKPNILFLFADDQSYETVHALGNDRIETPHIDGLVREGTTFTHAYNMGSWSGAVCVASRCMLNTGRFLWSANAIYRETEAEREAGRFWSEYMKGAGYRTYMTGKWHVRANAAKAFDVAAHVRGGMPKQTPQGYGRPVEGQEDPWKPWEESFGGYWEGGTHWSEVVANDALDFLEDAAGQEKPFFMYIAFNAPHDPRQSPRRFVDRYPLDTIMVPKNYLPLYPYKDSIALGTGQRDEKLAPFPRTEYAVKVNRQEYYAIISHMDEQIGRILEGLKASGLAENTYIFYTADHGLSVGHHGLMGKQNMYDHSVRVPFVVNGPGITENHRITVPIYLQDLMPTTLQLAGVDKPDHVDFTSIMPLLEAENAWPYKEIYGAYLNVQRSITVGEHKLISYPSIKKRRLFNLAKDPLEMHDLADDRKHADLLDQLTARLAAMQKKMDDPLVRTKP
ncbi:MAG: sulfatase-like hydrolase/transferase [Planctomycetota bacterium]|nr:sulfatase-like hydrolase/transferase [Planctomycetota bacterium]